MLFSSILFIFYFLPIVLILYYAAFWSRTVQNMILLIMSLVFYAWGEPKYIALMVGSIVFNYCFGILIAKEKKQKIRKFWLITAIIGNVGTLFLFKYLHFTVTNINILLNQENLLPVPNVILPIGISFFTFQAMSYVIDVYRNTVQVQKNPFYLGLYISFFPQLVAGPIVRYETVSEQIINRKETWQKFSVGSCRFIVGLSKKLIIANAMAVVVDRIFALHAHETVTVTLAWVGAIAYTLQIYYDFSAYSDMAIGLALMFGFRFNENFNYPYTSKSISEFWRRWHISLGSWFKDYVYFPMGGSRVKNLDKMVRNLLVVWLLTGFWHGAEWTFIFWGLINFACICVEKLISFETLKIKSWMKSVYCMFIVILGFVIFRAETLGEAGQYLGTMLGLHKASFYSDYTLMFLRENLVVFVLGIIFCMPIARKTNELLYNNPGKNRVFMWLYPIGMLLLFAIDLSFLMKGTYNPFIYFNY